ncbi:MAG: hypothetical protein KAH05_03005, partial [Clostridiales bacterium]|nr:hypothetical protein [Clostridiales bacterium]
KDIYLDYPWIAADWRKIYGTPKLSDFVAPLTGKEIAKQYPVSVKGLKPWRVYAGKDECQWMYPQIREILDICERLVRGLYPRGVNDRFVEGDAGCFPGQSCPNHAGAHNNQETVDFDYCTMRGFNMTHYRRFDMPVEYDGTNINIWRDRFPMRNLKIDVFDTEKNYALYEILSRIYVSHSRDFKVSTGLFNHFSSIYRGVDDVLHGDDFEAWCHYWHMHAYMVRNGINYNALVTSNLPQLLLAA